MFFDDENNEVYQVINEIVSKIQFISLKRSMLDHLPEDKEDIILENKRIIEIEPNSFHKFLHAQKINLSNNLLTDLDSDLFSVHENLEEIDLSQNALQTINKNMLFYSPVLRKLNFSRNSIRQIDENCIFSFCLVDLDLSDNKIEIVHPEAFFYLLELKSLNLSNNRIKSLQLTACRLRFLNANNNHLESIDLHLNEITCVLLQKNKISFINNFALSNNTETLTVLNLSNEETAQGINDVFETSFAHLTSLKELQLNVKYYFDFNCLKYLLFLSFFSLSYHGTQYITGNTKGIGEMLALNKKLKTFILTVAHFGLVYLKNMDLVISLQNIRLKCLNVKSDVTLVDIRHIFSCNRHLKTIELDNLNWFIVPKRSNSVLPCLEKLICKGIKNIELDSYFCCFPNLILLKISDGNTIYLKNGLFADLKNLKYLYLENLQLIEIKQNIFKYNLSLEILSLKNNLILSIAKYSFSRLTKLKHLNLEGNPLVASSINAKTFYGLKNFGTVISLDNASLFEL